MRNIVGLDGRAKTGGDKDGKEGHILGTNRLSRKELKRDRPLNKAACPLFLPETIVSFVYYIKPSFFGCFRIIFRYGFTVWIWNRLLPVLFGS